jgi:hypothetical protein
MRGAASRSEVFEVKRNKDIQFLLTRSTLGEREARGQRPLFSSIYRRFYLVFLCQNPMHHGVRGVARMGPRRGD